MNSVREKAARELLAFYQEAGVDTPIGETPIDRFAGPAPVAPANAPPAMHREAPATAQASLLPADRAVPKAGVVAPSPEAAVMAAREAATHAASLDDLRAILEGFEGCGLRKTASRLCFARGNPQARVMFVGEAPGYEEDKAGLPFVGKSGRLLDLMMGAIGLDEGSVYIANIVPWRPPGNRTPTPQESAICLPFLRRQIELANPDLLICLGNPSAQAVLGTREGITRIRGRWMKFDTGTREINAMPTYHPAFLLRSPLQKRFSWRDFLAIKKALTQ
ncbi:MAG: uracil-DNA glycosylase [Xanthobacteraceae bacterium]